MREQLLIVAFDKVEKVGIGKRERAGLLDDK